MDVHTDVTVTLTDKGAEILNKRGQWFRDNVKGSTSKIDYKEGDSYTAVLWEIMEIFGPHCSVGARVPFTVMVPVEK